MNATAKNGTRNPRIKEFMQAHGLKDNAALQSYFTARVQKLVAAHHRIMEGWDEVLAPNTPKDVVIQSWRGPKSSGRRGEARATGDRSRRDITLI